MKFSSTPVHFLLFFALTLLSYLPFGSAQQSATAELQQLPVMEYKLQNGLTVLLLERHHSPTVACQIAFKVGSVDERTGVTGAAHMLEHMMFKGTKVIGTTNYEAEVPIMAEIDRVATAILNERLKGEKADGEKIREWNNQLKLLQEKQKPYILSNDLSNIYQREGGTDLNAYTSDDYTNYIIKLPSNKLELWCWLESDRIANPVFREFYAEKEVVREERRMRYDNDPFGSLWELFGNTQYLAHPYRWLTIGYASDIENYRRETVQEFFTRYYAPNNAVIVWVGSFQKDNAIQLIEKYFGGIPAQPQPEPVTTVEPEQKGERRVYLEYDANPSLILGWQTVEVSHSDQAPIEVLSSILSDGRTSRLYRRMREQEALVSDVSVYSFRGKYPANLLVMAEPLQGVSIDKVEQVIREEIQKLENELVTDWELQRVKNQLQSAYVQKLESNFSLARELAEFECKADWTYLQELDQRLQSVTAADIQRVVKKYLQPSRITVAILKPTKVKGDSPGS